LVLFWSLCYLVIRCLLQLVLLRPRSQDFKELEIVVLRHELAVPRRQARRAELTSTGSSPCSGESAIAALGRAVVSGHADGAAALAQPPGRSPLDVRRDSRRHSGRTGATGSRRAISRAQR
jgi:hypothetical protein